MEPGDISFIGAFAAGLLSFISPCVLPLIPSYITYITGFSFAELNDANPSKEFADRQLFINFYLLAD